MTDELPDLGDALRDALPTYSAPEGLRAFARGHAAQELSPHVRRPNALRHRLLLAASLLLTFGAGWGAHVLTERRSATAEQNALEVAVADTHLRSLMSAHLTDVRSSDRHTVKPWFAGKVPLAPSVPDLSSDGFPLVGGRVESVGGHPSAALVYARRLHMIDLFIWTTAAPDAESAPASYHGFAMVHWTAAGLAYWAVSDAGGAELAEFAARYRANVGGTQH